VRTLPRLGSSLVEEIEKAWEEPQPDWARSRLLVVRLIAQHEHTVAEIMKIAGVCRQTAFTYRDTVVTQGVKGLRQRGHGGGHTPTVRGAVAREWCRPEKVRGLVHQWMQDQVNATAPT